VIGSGSHAPWRNLLASDRGFPLLLAGALALGGCTTLDKVSGAGPSIRRDSLQAFSLSGRFALRHQDVSHAGRIFWRHEGEKNHLIVSSPFGQALAEVLSDAGGARLSASDGKTYEAPTADELLVSVLGYPLPLGKLVDWVRGRIGQGELLVRDRLGRPLEVQERDWHLTYQYDEQDDEQALPGRVFVERSGSFALRLRIDEWQNLSPGD